MTSPILMMPGTALSDRHWVQVSTLRAKLDCAAVLLVVAQAVSDPRILTELGTLLGVARGARKARVALDRALTGTLR